MGGGGGGGTQGGDTCWRREGTSRVYSRIKNVHLQNLLSLDSQNKVLIMNNYDPDLTCSKLQDFCPDSRDVTH